MISQLSGLLPENLVYWGAAFMLVFYAAMALIVLIFPDPTRLAMAKDVGTVLLALFSVERAAHTGRAVWGTGNGDTPKVQ